MKKQPLLSLLSLLAAALLLAALPTEADAAIYEDTVRLHILANSDSEEDQAVKLALRDHILHTYASSLGACESRAAAEETVSALLEKIRSSADAFLSERGVPYRSEVTFTVEHYETRRYEEFTLPAGYYPSLRILLGNAEGKNWWCVMYPPLCLSMSLDTDTEDAFGRYNQSEQRLIRGEYRVRFKLLEAVTGLMGQKTKTAAKS